MAKLEVKNAMQQYLYGTTGVNDLTFSVEDGCFCLFGDDEAGKTSALEMLAGNLSLYRGSIFYNGVERSGDIRGKFSVTYVRQRGGLLKNRSVYANLAYPLKLRKVLKKERESLVLNAMNAVGLRVGLRTSVKKLTAYQIALLKLARCFLRVTDFVFVDDVTQGLTEAEQNQMIEEIYPKIAELPGVKVFALKKIGTLPFCERGAVLVYGITEQVGKISDFFENPETLNVFLYSHNGVTTEDGVLNVDQAEVSVGDKKIQLNKALLAQNASENVIVATDADGNTEFFSYPEEKRVYFY